MSEVSVSVPHRPAGELVLADLGRRVAVRTDEYAVRGALDEIEHSKGKTKLRIRPDDGSFMWPTLDPDTPVFFP